MKQGEGMPNYENNLKRGNLYITFDVNFPRGTFEDQDKEGKKFCLCPISIYPNLKLFLVRYN